MDLNYCFVCFWYTVCVWDKFCFCQSLKATKKSGNGAKTSKWNSPFPFHQSSPLISELGTGLRAGRWHYTRPVSTHLQSPGKARQPLLLQVKKKMCFFFKQSFRKSYNCVRKAEDSIFLCMLSAVFPVHVVLCCQHRWEFRQTGSLCFDGAFLSLLGGGLTKSKMPKSKIRFLNRCKLACIHALGGAMLI